MTTKKRRVSIVVTDPIYELLYKEAEKIGISVPTYCAFALGTHLVNQQRAYDMISEGVNQAMIVNALESDEL